MKPGTKNVCVCVHVCMLNFFFHFQTLNFKGNPQEYVSEMLKFNEEKKIL